MTYQDKLFEKLLQGMLERVPKNIDTREGSIVYNALAPAAVELRLMYIKLEEVIRESFADTESREYLVRKCAERGIKPKEASKASLKGEFNMDIPIGTRFSLDALYYTVTEKISDGVFILECETPGDAGNRHFGQLIPVEYISGLTQAELTELSIPGEEDEDVEVLRERYFASLNPQSYGGNIADYVTKVRALQGVGGVKVYPVWNGGGTVRLSIISSTYEPPAPELLEMVQTAVDPVQNQGEGMGIAPIGHVVTVTGVNPVLIDIATNFTYEEGWTWEQARPMVEEVVDNYLNEVARAWAGSSQLVVRISHLETRLLDLEAVLDISGTTINGLAANLILGDDDIPVRGEIFE